MPKVALHTLGCKLNFAETSMLGKQFVDRGYDIVGFGEEADVCLINTCSVTERADRECRQIIRRARRTSPNPIVVVTGCYAQLEPEEVASINGVDIVLGAKEKFSVFDYLETAVTRSTPQVFVSDIETVDNFGVGYSTQVSDRTRAFLKVQDGCDYNCSFCTIPLARGASRSQPVDVSVSQARLLVSQGYKEIVLTGVNVGDYGKKIGQNLLALLTQLVQVEGLERIRISSIEPNLLNDDILSFVASHPKMAKHFHIPLQSGDDEILKLMRRRYTTAFYERLITHIRERIPDCGIGVDVIVGFPGETDSHFERTVKFLTELPATYLHVFTYSERPNTPATAFSRTVEPRVRYQRNKVLRLLGKKKKRQFYSKAIGATVKVLMEGDVQNGIRYGFSDNYIRVGVPADSVAENSLVPVRIVSARDEKCLGEIPIHRQIDAQDQGCAA